MNSLATFSFIDSEGIFFFFDWVSEAYFHCDECRPAETVPSLVYFPWVKEWLYGNTLSSDLGDLSSVPLGKSLTRLQFPFCKREIKDGEKQHVCLAYLNCKLYRAGSFLLGVCSVPSTMGFFSHLGGEGALVATAI